MVIAKANGNCDRNAIHHLTCHADGPGHAKCNANADANSNGNAKVNGP